MTRDLGTTLWMGVSGVMVMVCEVRKRSNRLALASWLRREPASCDIDLIASTNDGSRAPLLTLSPLPRSGGTGNIAK